MLHLKIKPGHPIQIGESLSVTFSDMQPDSVTATLREPGTADRRVTLTPGAAQPLKAAEGTVMLVFNEGRRGEALISVDGPRSVKISRE